MNANNSSPAHNALPVQGEAQLLLARIGDRRFALPATHVLEIVADAPVTPVTPLPWAPVWVCGLANIGGRILPLLDPALLLGIDTPPGGELVLVNTAHSPCALRTAEVVARVVVDATALRRIDGEGGLVIAEFEYEGTPVLVLDPDRLGLLLAADAAPQGEAGLLGELEAREQREDIVNGEAFLAFRVGGARYAIALAEVGEVVFPPALTPIPGAVASVAGIGMLREDPLLFVDAGRLFEVEAGTPAAALVLGDGQLRIGLRVDAIEGVDRIEPARIRTLDEGNGDFTGVAHDEEGRITALTSTERLLDEARRRQFAPLAPAASNHDETGRREFRAFLEVAVQGEHFGLPLDEVIRIIDWSQPREIDGEQHHLSGAINVEGSIVPVVDHRLLHPRSAQAPRGAWVLVGNSEQSWALAVDETRRIVSIPRDDIEERSGRDDLLAGIARVDRQLLSLLSLRQALAGAQA